MESVDSKARDFWLVFILLFYYFQKVINNMVLQGPILPAILLSEVALFRFKQYTTTFAFIKPLTSICGHGFNHAYPFVEQI